MTANEIRSKFLNFFEKKGHSIIASDSLVPKDDPTVLFTTAGMQQFKRQFLGQIDDVTKATSCQKCLRTDDLDDVGKTPYHHTFFEMLGNFSFGDYFKKDAILWAWEFLTKELKIPKERLWVSVYKDDEEAESIWRNSIGLEAKRILRLGDKNNFWPSQAIQNGPNGPCGPCSEIFYDYGDTADYKKADFKPDYDSPRFSEVWNLVFTQYNRQDGGKLDPLPTKNIDTGMGLERLTAVIQGKKSNYETDLFLPIFKALEEVLEQPASKKDAPIIVDHVRAIVFAIADGVVPSNKSRGSVVRKLIYKATNLTMSQVPDDQAKANLYRLVPAVIATMKGPYPELAAKQQLISDQVQRAEEAFLEIRKKYVPEFYKQVEKAQSTKEMGELYFKFYDTHGLPIMSLYDRKGAFGLKISEEKHKEAQKYFEQELEQQKSRSRAASQIKTDVFSDRDLHLDVPKTKFLGYEQMAAPVKILKILKSGQILQQAQSSSGEITLILDQTPFYAESGGQVGDSGKLLAQEQRVVVSDTQKSDDIYLHTALIEKGTLKPDDTLHAEVNKKRRLSIMRNHTATHLLQAALRKILGAHVQQQGSLVAEDRLRFDFTNPGALRPEEIQRIENQVNEWILDSDQVKKEVMSLEQAKQQGALAFFAEKYGKTVRVVTVGNGYSKEFCGGTHLDMTGQIGLFKIIGESAIAQGIRRLEANTGFAALADVKTDEQQLTLMAKLLKADRKDLLTRVDQQVKRVKELESELEKFRLQEMIQQLDAIFKKAETIGRTKIITHRFENADIASLRKISDLIKQKYQSHVILLGAKSGSEAYILTVVSENLVSKGINANEIIQSIAPIMDGSGGGRSQMAQAGSKNSQNLDKTLSTATGLIKKKLTA